MYFVDRDFPSAMYRTTVTVVVVIVQYCVNIAFTANKALKRNGALKFDILTDAMQRKYQF